MPTPESKKPEDGAPSLSVVIEGEDLQKNVPTDAGLAPQPSGAPQQKTPRKTAGKRRRKGRGASQTQNKAMPATQSAEVASAPAAASVDAIQTAEPSREEAGGSLSASAFPAESCPGASPQADAGAPKLEPVSDAAATGSTPGATMSTPAAADKPRSPLAKKGHSVMAMNALLEDHCSPTSTTKTYAALAGPRDFLRAVHGSSEKAEEVWPRYCAVHTEGSYKLMAAALSAVALFTADERRRIDTYLKVVQQAAAKRTQAAQWLDEETKKVAAEKLLSARTFLWPSKKYLTNEGVEEAYKDFPENGTSFVRLWIDSRQSGRRTVGSEAYFEEQQLTSSMSLPYAEYVHMLNAVELAVGAMRPPLYYPRGTKAMLHGGLGYFFARQLTRAVDDEGVKVDPHGRILSSWVSEASGPAFDKRLRGCLAENESVFPEVPALEVAYAAFREDVNPTQELLSPELSEEQVFFIAACSTSCSKSSAGNAFTGQCNKAVMNFAPFAQAFGCAPGSRMNPEKKCSFFD
ncbi:endothelin-converting enzyme 1-like isoform X2 [Amblyomma americanum]